MKKPVVILLHLVYWSLYVLLLCIFYWLMMIDKPMAQGQFSFWALVMMGFAIIPALIAFYTCYILLFKKFLVPRKILHLVIAAICVAIAATVVGELILYITAGRRTQWTVDTIISMGLMVSFNALLNGFIGLGIRSFVTWYNELKWKEELTKRNHEMELTLVRSSINPHFLFNTINNIDVLIEKDPGMASAYLNKLSDIMRFTLYETKAASIPLEKELLYIDKYLELQKIRTANPDYVQYSITGNNDGLTIPPMLFIPFIENAFKHATPVKTGCGISIHITLQKDRIIFDCTNNYTQKSEEPDNYSGLGNELIEKRLLLLYKDRHQLTITKQNGTYAVKLILPLLQ